MTRLMKIAAVAAVAALTLTACGSGETFTMTSDEGIAKIKELITTNVDTSKYKIYEVEWNEDGHDRKLENILTQIDVYYIDAENNDYNLSFLLTGGKFTTDGPKKKRPSDLFLRMLDAAQPRRYQLRIPREDYRRGRFDRAVRRERAASLSEVGRDVPFPQLAGHAA